MVNPAILIFEDFYSQYGLAERVMCEFKTDPIQNCTEFCSTFSDDNNIIPLIDRYQAINNHFKVLKSL
jgi:hypothetical protein